MGNITITKGQGSLGRPLAGEDHISGLVFYHDDLPDGFASDARVKSVTDITAAEDLGILDDGADEIKATGGKVVVTAAGVGGTIWTVAMDGTTLGTYTVVALDTEALVAAGLRAAITAGTSGYTAAGSGANVLLTAPDGLGASINGGTHLTGVNSGAGTATITQFSGGENSFFDVMHYHIDEFFKMNPGATLWVGIFATPGSFTFDELITMQNATNGKIRQFGVYMKSTAFSTSHINSLEAIAEGLDAEIKNCSILYAADISNIALSALSDLRALNDPKCHAIIGQDAANLGAELFAAKGYSISCIGATLGVVSLSKVSENIGWVAKYQIAHANELLEPAFAEGTLLKDMTKAAIDAIDTKGYIFVKHYNDDSKTYFNDNHSCVATSSDYAFMNDNRTMDKAIRLVYARMLPQINGPVKINPTTGKLDGAIVKYLESLGNQALEQMERDEELSGYKTVIDPDQNLLQTSILQVVIKNVPIGVSRNINIKISFTNQI